MILRAFHLFFFLGLILALPVRAAEPVTDLLGMVTGVYDGDTLEINTAGTVRLIGIDVSERKPQAVTGILPTREARPPGNDAPIRPPGNSTLNRSRGNRSGWYSPIRPATSMADCLPMFTCRTAVR